MRALCATRDQRTANLGLVARRYWQDSKTRSEALLISTEPGVVCLGRSGHLSTIRVVGPPSGPPRGRSWPILVTARMICTYTL